MPSPTSSSNDHHRNHHVDNPHHHHDHPHHRHRQCRDTSTHLLIQLAVSPPQAWIPAGKTSCVWRSPVTRHDASSSTKTEISRLSSHVRRNVSGLLFLFEAVRCRFATMSASILVEGAHSGNLIQKETSLRVLPALGLASVPPILFINKPCLLQQARESPPEITEAENKL